jgi:hypothetical protein
MSALNKVWRAIGRFIFLVTSPAAFTHDIGVIRKSRRAKRMSLVLLMTLLNAEQRQEFRQFKYFHVIGGHSGDRYCIRIGKIANIDVLYDDDRVSHHLCVHPTGGVPVYDIMAAQLLYLQDPATELWLLMKANIHPTRPEIGFYSGPIWSA